MKINSIRVLFAALFLWFLSGCGSINQQLPKLTPLLDAVKMQAEKALGKNLNVHVASNKQNNLEVIVLSDKSKSIYVAIMYDALKDQASWIESYISKNQVLYTGGAQSPQKIEWLAESTRQIVPQTGYCAYCTNWERRGGVYNTQGYWGWVSKAIAGASTTACNALGGSMQGAACMVLVYEFVVTAITWVPPYWVCLELRSMPTNGPCPDDGYPSGSVRSKQYLRFA